MLWLADRVDEGLAGYRTRNGIEASWPARERIVAGLPGGPEGEALLDFARSVNATQIVVGISRGGSLAGLLAALRGGFVP